MNRRGQIGIPMLALMLLMTGFFFALVAWGKSRLWHMRLQWAADAAALSAARAEGQVLNKISIANAATNAFIKKGEIPLTSTAVGYVAVEDLPALTGLRWLIRGAMVGFKGYVIGVGQVVARANGAQGASLFFPMPDTYLRGKSVHAIVRVPPPALSYPKIIQEAYFVRMWSPRYGRAQPPHKTTWLVRRGPHKALATARLWLDVDSSAWFHNGGFPREDETFFRGLGTQSFYPHFNARLIPSTLTPDRLMDIVRRRRG